MEGRSAGQRPSWSWSYLGVWETGSTASSSSGTIVSSAYNSSFSRPSNISMAATSHLDYLEIQGDGNEPSRGETHREEHIRSLVQEFFGAPSGDDTRNWVLERRLTGLGVGWVLHLAYVASAGEFRRALDARRRSWIRALADVMQTFSSTALLFRPHRDDEAEEDEPVAQAQSCSPDQLQFAIFTQETIVRMLTFVDFIVDLDPNEVPAACQKISILLCVRDALGQAISQSNKDLLSPSPPSAQVIKRVQGEMTNLLSANVGRVSEAIGGTMEEIWAGIIESMEDSDNSWHIQTPHGSSDIHKVTRSATSHIRYLCDNYWSLTPIVLQAACLGKYATKIRDIANPLASLIVHMMSSLGEKLDKWSQSLPDQGLRFLFLINNSGYIWQQLHGHNTCGTNLLRSYFTALSCQIDEHIQSYLQVSWALVLSYLVNPTPHCYGKNYSLSKFESEFQKTYTAQKCWKVTDPQMRTTLHKAITKKVIGGLTKYIIDNNVTTTMNFTPKNLEEMLQELFEG